MAKAEFLKEIRKDFEGKDLKYLNYCVGYYTDRLMDEGGVSDERVYEDLLTLLAVRLLHSERLVETAADGYERKAYELLREHYRAIFLDPDAVDQWMYKYCVGQVDYYMYLRDEERKKGWREIVEAMERVIRKKVE